MASRKIRIFICRQRMTLTDARGGHFQSAPVAFVPEAAVKAPRVAERIHPSKRLREVVHALRGNRFSPQDGFRPFDSRAAFGLQLRSRALARTVVALRR